MAFGKQFLLVKKNGFVNQNTLWASWVESSLFLIMTNQDVVKGRGGGEALRKHREKRRAQAGLKSDQEGPNYPKSPLGETPVSILDSLEHKRNKQQIIKTIVATESDRERMRKISKLGLEHPAERSKASYSRKSPLGKEDMIITTTSAGAEMRKISILGFEDPADVVYSSAKGSGGSTREQRGNGGRLRASNSRVDQGNEPLGRRAHSARQSKRGQVQRSKSEDSGGFVAPFVVPSVEGSGSNGRTLSAELSIEIPSDEKDVVRKEGHGHVKTKSLDFEMSFGDDILGDSEFPPVQVRIPQHDTRENGPKAFGGVIETTNEKKELMRKVSALGMQDPVFRNLHKDRESRQSSTIDEEQDFTSPRGHKETDMILESPSTNNTSAITGSSRSDRGSPDETGAYVPPVGSFVRRTALPPAHTPSPPGRNRKTVRSLRPNPGRVDRSKRSSSETRTTQQSPETDYSFIPPSGSFNLRKPSTKPPVNRDTVLKDIELANRAQSMFEKDSLLAMSASNLGQSLSNLNQSLGELNFNESSSSLQDSWTSDSQRIAANRSSSAISSKPPPPHEPYMPPPSPSQMLNKDSDVNRSSSESKGRSNKSGRKTYLPPGSKNQLSKTNSIRSWDGDMDILDPMADQASNPLWASMSQLDTNFAMTDRSTRRSHASPSQVRKRSVRQVANGGDLKSLLAEAPITN